jgi:transcriptional regulator with XRE-family HTH domain
VGCLAIRRIATIANRLGGMKRPATHLGEIIRRQRELNRLTLRQFAAMAGISNPYLSQIERGLRVPSEAVMAAIARSLKTNPDLLYEEAGLIADGDHDDDARARVEAALEADPALAPRQRRALMEIYDVMVLAGPVPRPRRRS